MFWNHLKFGELFSNSIFPEKFENSKYISIPLWQNEIKKPKSKNENRKSKNENRKTKNENRKTKGKNQKSTNKFLDKIEKRKSKVENRKTKIENRKTKIEIFFRVAEPVDFFSQRVKTGKLRFSELQSSNSIF